jgi:hypothetical protein
MRGLISALGAAGLLAGFFGAIGSFVNGAAGEWKVAAIAGWISLIGFALLALELARQRDEAPKEETRSEER